MRLYLSLFVAALSGCADISPQSRWQHADQLASAASWSKRTIPAGKFVLSAYVPKVMQQVDILTIYIEGDGLAWLSPSRPSDDPTPRNPVALEMALRHTQGAAVYLARPCQYVKPEEAGDCRQTYWTDKRFAPEVIAASDQAISVLKQRYGSKKLVLIGYSGGGAVAALAAARRDDIIQLITVAGNLDHRAWTGMHRISPLAGSLNPADEWQALVSVPQWHFVGGNDEVVGRAVAESYASKFPLDHRPNIISIPDFNHVCCWAKIWPELLKQANR